MKFWLIIFFFNAHGDLVQKREILYKDEASCYLAMDNIRPPVKSWTTQMNCVEAAAP